MTYKKKSLDSQLALCSGDTSGACSRQGSQEGKEGHAILLLGNGDNARKGLQPSLMLYTVQSWTIV